MLSYTDLACLATINNLADLLSICETSLSARSRKPPTLTPTSKLSPCEFWDGNLDDCVAFLHIYPKLLFIISLSSIIHVVQQVNEKMELPIVCIT
jgi:hypothetical protein